MGLGGVRPVCWVVVKLRSMELEAQSHGQAADAEKKLNSLIMSNDEGDSTGGSTRPTDSTGKSTASTPPLLGCIPHSIALSGVAMFTSPKVSASLSSGSSSSIMALTQLTPLADILPGQTNNLSTDAVSVGPLSPPVPLKLAQKIWRNEFIDLQELLPARLGIPEPTLLDVLTKTESAKPKKEIKTVQQGGRHALRLPGLDPGVGIVRKWVTKHELS